MSTQPSLTCEEMLEAFRTIASERKERIDELKRRNEELENTYAALKDRVAKQGERNAKLTETNNELQRQNKALKARNDALMKSNAQLKQNDIDLNKKFQEIDQRIKSTDKKISTIGSNVGKIVEHTVFEIEDIANRLEETLGRKITQKRSNAKFENQELGIKGEIDMLIGDGGNAVLVEVKTTLETADIKRHIERLEKYRRFCEAKGDKRRILGAVAGMNVEGDAVKVAHENGLYVITRSSKSITVPEGFQATEWNTKTLTEPQS